MSITDSYHYKCLIVDSEVSTRMRLKQATTAVPRFKNVTMVSSALEARQRMSRPDEVDVIFVSSSIDGDTIQDFIKESKKTDAGQDSAYVLVLKGSDQDGAQVAQNMLLGGDGFLFEPYAAAFDHVVDA